MNLYLHIFIFISATLILMQKLTKSAIMNIKRYKINIINY